jgi:hypothetical protein
MLQINSVRLVRNSLGHRSIFSLSLVHSPRREGSEGMSLSKVGEGYAWDGTQTREYVDWRWPLSRVYSVMMVFLAQLACE